MAAGARHLQIISQIERNRVLVTVAEVEEKSRELAFALTVAMPVPKNERARFLVEKLTELGATRLIPLKTERSVFQEKSLGKLERYVIEACKQCGRNQLMEIGEIHKFDDLVADDEVTESRYILDPRTSSQQNTPKQTDSIFLIGPEGGFSERELSSAAENGWQPISLGRSILRMETAALAVVARASG